MSDVLTLDPATVAAIAAAIAEQTPKPPAPLLDAQQAGALLAVPPSWLLQEARAGRVPHTRLGRYVRFDSDDLTEWRRRHTKGPRR